ncbi:phosphodiester glycosidase family protein [Streptomyces sp. NPDC091649]|uniref:phosphodiester glycosidase family protein n=1 Tax=Streptomyces sp. NPDC091649 TaxID=3366004 RepID=UPI00382B6CF5
MTLTTIGRRGALAATTALTSVLLLLPPGASSVSAAGIFPEVPGWSKLETQYEQLDPGVELFRYRETAPAALRADMPPREMNVLRVDPAVSAVRIESAYGRQAGKAEKVVDQLNQYAAAQRPLAGINGSYFTPEGTHHARPDTPESVQTFGTVAHDGVLLGAACTSGKRRSLILQHGIPYVTTLATDLSVTGSVPPSGGGSAVHRIDDINRNPGGAMTCARDDEDGIGDQREKDLSDGIRDGYYYVEVDGVRERVKAEPGITYKDGGKSVTVLQDPAEIILFNDRYGMVTPTPGMNPKIGSDNQAGFEVLVDADGTLTRPADWTTRGGHLVPRGKHILQAIGTGPTAWLKGMFDAKAKLTIDQKVTDLDDDNRAIALDESVDILSGGHLLMRDGVFYAPRSCSSHRTEGTGADAICRDSRTTLGVDDQGRTVIVTITGPRVEPTDEQLAKAQYDGAFIDEAAIVLQGLKVQDAINLDGGGSTTLLTYDASDSDNYKRHTGLTDLKHRPVFDSVYVGVGGLAVTPGS